MYALAIIRYRVPIEEVVKVTDEHRAYLRELKQKGTVLVKVAILDRDLFRASPKELLAARVVMTIVDGAVAFEQARP